MCLRKLFVFLMSKKTSAYSCLWRRLKAMKQRMIASFWWTWRCSSLLNKAICHRWFLWLCSWMSAILWFVIETRANIRGWNFCDPSKGYGSRLSATKIQWSMTVFVSTKSQPVAVLKGTSCFPSWLLKDTNIFFDLICKGWYLIQQPVRCYWFVLYIALSLDVAVDCPVWVVSLK